LPIATVLSRRGITQKAARNKHPLKLILVAPKMRSEEEPGKIGFTWTNIEAVQVYFWISAKTFLNQVPSILLVIHSLRTKRLIKRFIKI